MKEIITEKTTGFKNNCLFDAILYHEFQKSNSDLSQNLREKCNEILTKTLDLPIIPDNLPAGEQYLLALSLLFDKAIKVIKDEDYYIISHIEGLKEEITLKHLGSAEHGHWMAIS